MKAALLLRERRAVADGAFTEIVLWHLPVPARGSAHPYKYRFAFVVDDVCVVRYDNEAGKGDHRHVGDRESAYAFVSVERLFDDFRADVARWWRDR